jgi:hypothetical protein
MSFVPGARLDARERRLLAWGSVALFLAGWADVSVKNVSDTLFLKRIGVELLPVAFLVNAFLLMGTTSLLGLLATRVDPLRLFTRSLAALGLLLGLLWGLVHVGGAASYPVLLIASKHISAIALISFSVATSALMDPRQAKQLLPPLLAGGTLGSILGSFASGPLGRWLDVEGLLPVAGGLLLLGAMATLPLRRLPAARIVLERRPGAGVRAGVRTAATPERLTARQLWHDSWLFRALTLSALFCGAVGPMLYFQFSYVADLATRGQGGEEKLLSLYGLMRGWLQLGVLVVQLWVAPALYRRFGVPLAGTFSPLLYLLGFGGLTFRLGLPEGVAAQSGATVQDQGIHDPAQRLLSVFFPEEIRPRVTALVEGTAKRAGGCIGNLLVIAAVWLGNVTWVGLVGVPLAILWFGITLRIWRGYPSLVLSMATEPRRVSRPGVHAYEILDANTLRSLARTLQGTDLERCRASIEVLRELRPDAAPALLASAIPEASEALRPLLLETLEALLEDLHVKAAEHRARAHALGQLLRDRPPLDPRERAALVRVFARFQDATQHDPGTAPLLGQLARDPAPAVRVAAETALYRLGLRAGSAIGLRRVLGPALEHEDPLARAVACLELRALLIEDPHGEPSEVGPGRPEWHARLGLLVASLFRPAARAAAAHAIADVAAHRGRVASAASAEMFALCDDPDPAVRASVLRFIGHARRIERAGLLAERLAAHHPDEAAAAADGLRALGAAALDVLLPEFSFGRRSVRDAIVPLLRELDVDPEAFEAQLQRELEGVAERLLELASLRGQAAPILIQRLEERVQGGLHTAFLLLAALHDDDRIVDLGDALRRPHSPRERAIRIEALEGLLTAEERARLVPFVEDPRLEIRIDAAIKLLGRRPLSRSATLEAMLDDPDSLTRMLLAGTMIETLPGESGGPTGPEAGMLTEVEVLLQLRGFQIFEQLTVRELADVARLVRQEQFPAGATIVREGEFESSMYAITDGRVCVTKQDAVLTELRKGDIFGEMAIFDGEARSATVAALEPTRVLRIEGRDLLALMEELPGIAIAICRTLSRLVRTLTVRKSR